jgi:hypothetical protein
MRVSRRLRGALLPATPSGSRLRLQIARVSGPQLRNRLDGHGLGEERCGPGLLVLDAHAEGGIGGGAIEAAIFEEKDGDFVGIGGGLQDDGAQLAEGTDQLGGEGADGFDALDLGVERRGGLEFEVGGGLVALGADVTRRLSPRVARNCSTALDSSA